MEPVDPVLLQALQILGPLIGAGLGVKVVLNGTVARVGRIEEKVDKVIEGHGERIARLEERTDVARKRE